LKKKTFQHNFSILLRKKSINHTPTAKQKISDMKIKHLTSTPSPFLSIIINKSIPHFLTSIFFSAVFSLEAFSKQFN
jgi:hypothetical protein